ncbi:MAG: apolipoprotein N-acyltransferase [Elusimicrobiota bacterium]
MLSAALRRRAGALLLGAVLYSLGHTPGPWGLLMWFALVPFLRMLERLGPVRAFLWSWAFGTLSWLIGFRWFLDTIETYLVFSPIESAMSYLAICLYSGLLLAGVGGAAAAMSGALADFLRCSRRTAAACVFVPAMICAEAYFPLYNPLPAAHTQFYHLPLLQLLEVFGTAGLAWLLYGANACLYVGLFSDRAARYRWTGLKIAVALLLLNECYGLVRIRQVDAWAARRMREGFALRVAVIQGSLPREQVEKPESFASNLAVYNELTRSVLARGPVDLVVWPQAAYERTLTFERSDYARRRPRVDGRPLEEALRLDLSFSAPAILSGTSILQGDETRPRRMYYSAFLTDSQRRYQGMVGKYYLTPFSEYVPLGAYFPFLRRFSRPGMEPLSRGPRTLLFHENGARLGVYICYEEFVARHAAWYARDRAQLLIALSSDAWLGPGLGPTHHLTGSRLRAIENRKYLLRAVTTGISAVVEPTGRLRRTLGMDVRGALVETVATMDMRTPHAFAGEAFYHLGALLLLLINLLPFAARRRARRVCPSC